MVDIPRLTFFGFRFNGGRGIRKNQVDWTTDDPTFDSLLQGLTGSGTITFLLTAVPANSIGVDSDTALVRVSSLSVHAYKKVAGSWARQWAFSGGDSVLLTRNLASIDTRVPATDLDATTFSRGVGFSGYSPITVADIDKTQRAVNAPADLRGGNNGSRTRNRGNILPNQKFSSNLAEAFTNHRFSMTVPLYIYFSITQSGQIGVTLASVSYNNVDFPVTKQSDVVYRNVREEIWVADATHVWSEVNAYPFELTLKKDALLPLTYNRYCVVTNSDTPTEADFLSRGAYVGGGISVLIPSSGWTNGQGYLHFALPASQDTPTIVGLAGGTNLIDDFAGRSRANTITINGDTMRTLSSKSRVFQMTTGFNQWIIR